jgi:hypothetical protein
MEQGQYKNAGVYACCAIAIGIGSAAFIIVLLTPYRMYWWIPFGVAYISGIVVEFYKPRIKVKK